MRTLKKIIAGIVIFIATIYVLPAMLLQLPYFQEKISHQTASFLSKKLQAEVHIRQIELGLFNKLIMRDVYMEDTSGEVLFQAKRVAAGFDLISILKKKWRFDSVQLFTFQFNLCKENDGSPMNIQFIIDAFAKKDTTATNPAIDLQIKNLSMRMGSFSYRVKDREEKPDRFNPGQILMTGISAKIQIQNLNNKELALQFNRLSFTEHSGFKMKNGTFDLIANDTVAKIDRLTIELDKSSFHFSDIRANYNLSSASEGIKEPVAFDGKLETSTIYPNELSAVIPIFSRFDDRINTEFDFTGIGNDIFIKNLSFRYYNQISISANADLKNVFHPNRTLFYVRSKVSNSFFSPEGVERIINYFSQQPVEFPEQIKRLKDVRFEGSLNGSSDDLTAWGVLNTNVGVIRTNLKTGNNEARFLKGHISSESLNLRELMNDKDFGEMIFDIQLDAAQDSVKKFFGSVDATFERLVYKGYTYNNLTLNGDFSPESFNGRLNLYSTEGRISGKGLWIFKGKDSQFDFQAKVSDLQLDKLNLTNKYDSPLLSFEVGADLTGNTLDNFTGSVSLNSLLFETDKGNYFLDSLKIISSLTEQGKQIRINSNIVNGEIWGNYSLNTIIPSLKQTFSNYLPSLFKPNLKISGVNENDLSVDLKIEDLTDASDIFKLPFSLRGQTDVSGRYSGNDLKLDVTSPHAVIGGMRTDSLMLKFTTAEQTAQTQITGTSLQKKGTKMKFDIQLEADSDELNTYFHWGNGLSNYRGDLKLSTVFSKQDNNSPIRIETNVKKTDMIFNDSIWTLNPASITVDLSNIRIDSLYAYHDDQFLKINGAISNNPADELLIELNRMDLEYIFSSLDIPALEFGGMATGYVKANDLFVTRKMETDLDITDLSFNKVNFGHLDLTGTWDDENQGILIQGKTQKNDSSFIDIDGIIYPVKRELSIDFNARNADARFLRKYMDQVVQDLTGNLSGHLRLFGDLYYPTVEGDVFAQNCRFGVRFLNTFYTFTDSVKCLPDTIRISNTPIFDERGNRATASGYVKHNLFQDFYFNTDISFSNLLVYNATKAMNPMFYGTAYGNGTASLYGTEDVISIDVTMQNTNNTRMTLNFMEEPDIEEYDFVRFVSEKKPVAETVKNRTGVSTPTSSSFNNGPEIKFNLMVNPNQQAVIDIIMDPISGDKISGYGDGNIQVQYGTKTPLKVLGNYRIERGKYNFSMQQLFIRNFDIQEGSTLAFRGDPFTADLDIKANYTVSANLEDLDRQLIENRRSARNSVPVNCILMLNGPLNRPSVAFDLDLPGAPDELTRQVKSYIRTDDMMARQIVYLLVLNRFFTPQENMRDNSKSVVDWSFLSTQLSSMFGSLSDNLRLGTNFHQSNTGEQTSTEFELMLSSQLLNNRLIINGNFGYINNSVTNRNQNNLPLIGDFDLEYKLTKSGDIRLKGFNHYNYRNYYSITPEMTQGFGILFRKDFNHWLDLLARRRSD